MNNYIIYNKITGEINRAFYSTSQVNQDIYLNENEDVLTNLDINISNPENVYIKDNQFFYRESKPNVYFDWINYEWVENAQKKYDYFANIVREQRNVSLAESDWVVIKANEYGQEVSNEWKVYRQELRDITNQPNFPLDVVFPEKPSV
jgi:hypothetical protein